MFMRTKQWSNSFILFHHFWWRNFSILPNFEFIMSSYFIHYTYQCNRKHYNWTFQKWLMFYLYFWKVGYGGILWLAVNWITMEIISTLKFHFQLLPFSICFTSENNALLSDSSWLQFCPCRTLCFKYICIWIR